MTTLHPDHRPTRLSLDGPDPAVPGVHVLHVHGALDRAGGARLLRLADARLALVRAGTREVTHLVVDLSGATGTGPGGAAALRHLRFACGRLGIGVHLAGADTVDPGGAAAGRAAHRVRPVPDRRRRAGRAVREPHLTPCTDRVRPTLGP